MDAERIDELEDIELMRLLEQRTLEDSGARTLVDDVVREFRLSTPSREMQNPEAGELLAPLYEASPRLDPHTGHAPLPSGTCFRSASGSMSMP